MEHQHRPRASEGLADDVSRELIQLGGKLTAARQAQGLSLEDLAQRLHLGPSQLDALESGARTRLPEIVYVIAQARRVADSLGLDIETELTKLRSSPRSVRQRPPLQASEAHTSVPLNPQRTSSEASARPGVPRHVAVRPGAASRATLLVVAALLLGLGAAALALRPRLQSQLQPRPQAALPSAASPAAPVRSADALVLSSQPASWVAVRDRAGQRLFEGMLSQEQRFPLGGGLEVLAGRPDLVRVSVGNEPARPLGTISEVAWRRFPTATTPP